MQLSLPRFKAALRGVVVVLALTVSALILNAQNPKPAPTSPEKPASSTPPPVLQSATQTNQPPLFPKDMVIMTVGDHKLTVADFTQIMAIFPPQQSAFYSGPGKQKFAEDFSQLLILSDEAKRRKLDDDPVVKQRLTLMSDQTLAQSLIQRIQEGIKIPDEEVEKYYNAHLKDYEEIKARHILIRAKGSPSPIPAGKKDLTDEEAKAKAEEIYKQVTAPNADFAAVAKAESYDEGSATKGGELGMYHRGQLVSQFEAVAFNLKVGEISQPVKTQFGYHIIKVDDRKTRSLEETKGDIENSLRRERLQHSLDALKKAGKVELNPQFFPAASPPTPPTPQAAAPPAPPAEKKN